MKLNQYFAFCAQAGVVPLTHTPDYTAWRLPLALLGLVCIGFLCMLLGIAFHVPHGGWLLAVYSMGAITMAVFWHCLQSVSYTHLTLPTIYSV